MNVNDIIATHMGIHRMLSVLVCTRQSLLLMQQTMLRYLLKHQKSMRFQ